jgi:glycosyltransferase involved in cell wall biosynthesis
MRRILHIIDSLSYNGRAKQLLVLGRGLLLQGNDVHVASLDDRGALAGEFAAAGIPTTQLDRRSTHDPVAYLRLHRLMSRLRSDVVHTWDFHSRIYGHVTSRTLKVRQFISGQHSIDPWKSGLHWYIDRRLAHDATRFVTSSVHVRDWCVNHGLPAETFTVIPPGIPPAPTSDVSRKELLRELQLPPDAKLIGVVGRLVPEKRVKDLIWAADLLRVLHDNLRLLIIGDGPQRPQLDQYARMASDLDHIRFLGERPDVWRIMPHLDVLWNADEYRNPSISILEAMAAGVPVIASDTPINREFIVEGRSGYLIPLLERAGRAARARHTDKIFTDGELASRLSTVSRQSIAEHFRSSRMVGEHASPYSKCGSCRAIGAAQE